MATTSPLPAAGPREPLPGRAGLLELAEAQRPRLDRLPTLQPVAAQLNAALAASFTQLAAQEVDLRVEAIEQQDLAACLAAADGESAVAYFDCPPRPGNGFIRIEDHLLRPLFDLALGGRRGAGIAAASPRPLTAIELRLVERLVRQILADLQRVFAPFARLEFRLGRVDGRPRPSRLTAVAGPAVLVRLRADVGTSAGVIDVALPGAAVEALRGSAAGNAADGHGVGAGWTSRLLAGIHEVDVELEAVLHEGMVDLGLARELKVGETVPLGIRPDAAIAVRSGGIDVATAGVAARDDRLVLAIQSRAAEERTSP